MNDAIPCSEGGPVCGDGAGPTSPVAARRGLRAGVSRVWRSRSDRHVMLVRAEHLSPWGRAAAAAAAVLCVAVGAGVVYATGGTRHAWPHVLYLPVLLAAWALGPAGGVTAGLVAGLAVGPAMPLEVDGGIAQSTANWVSRLGFFVLAGAVSGGLHRLARLQLARSRAQRRRFTALVEHAPDVVVTCAADGRITYASPALGRVLGRSPGAVLGMPLADLLHGGDAAVLRSMVPADAAADPSWAELRLRHADGSFRHLELHVRNLLADPDVAAVVCNGRDVTERRAAEAELRHQAEHDTATGLPNRARFTRILRGSLAAGGQGAGEVAVLLVVIDRYHTVQEGLDPEDAEQLVAAVGARMAGLVGRGDVLARFGTSEFALLCTGVDGPDAAQSVARRLLAAADEPYLLVRGEVRIQLRVGAALASAARHDPRQLIRDAYIAAHRALREGRRVAVFQEDWRARAASAVDTESALHAAVHRGELALCYQPIIDLGGHRPVALEALIRWHHPRFGTVSPADFIPVAEQTGAIVPIGRWVVESACAALAHWRAAPGWGDLGVSANLSACQLDDDDLVEHVAATLRAHRLPPAALTLELTETALLDDGDVILDALSGLGVGLALDDFGTGYSSLGHLERLPVDSLKIDRRFVSRLGRDDDAIVSAVIGLARTMGFSTVAEGVEEEIHVDRLVELGCDRAQGYFYARPLRPDDVVTALAAHG